MEWKKNINTNLGITIILVFAALFTIIDFYAISAEIEGYPFNELSGNTVNSDVDDTAVEDKDNSVIDDKEVVEENNSESHYVISDDISYDSIYTDKNVFDSDMNIRTVKDQVFLGGGYYGFLSVDDGKLNMSINRYSFKNEITYRDTSFDTAYLSHSFDGEKVKYIYYDYFKPSGDVVIWAITDAGNVYLNNFKCFYSGDVFDAKFFDNFEKKYSNVSDLRIVENGRGMELNGNGTELAIVVNGEVIEISRWGN